MDQNFLLNSECTDVERRREALRLNSTSVSFDTPWTALKATRIKSPIRLRENFTEIYMKDTPKQYLELLQFHRISLRFMCRTDWRAIKQANALTSPLPAVILENIPKETLFRNKNLMIK